MPNTGLVSHRAMGFDLRYAGYRAATAVRPRRRGDRIRVQPGLSVRADARLVRIVVHNLVDNAFKLTRECSDARVEVGAKDHDGERAFFVSDNGIGFDMRYAGKLFGAFERLHDDARYEGLGIGLTTVRRIIDRHGGKLWADSEPGSGATFLLRPACVTRRPPPNGNTPPSRSLGGQCRRRPRS